MRRKQALASIAVAILMVTAGCAGFLGGDDTTTPETETTTTPEETSAPPAEDLDSPPGVTDGEITNSSALYEAHVDSLNNTARDVEMSIHEDGEETTDRSVTITHGENAENLLMEMETEDGQQNIYQKDGLTIMDAPDQTVVSQGQSMAGQMAAMQSEQLAAVLVGLPLEVGTYTHDGTTMHDGEAVHKYTATEESLNKSAQGMENITEFSGEVLVEPDGTIHKITMDATEETDQGERSFSTTYELSNIGEATVEEPAWVQDIPQLKGELVNDGETVKLTNTGDTTIESGAQLTVTTGTAQTGFELSESLEPGQSVYLTGTETDGYLESVEQHSSAAVGEYDFSEDNRVAITGEIDGVTLQLSIVLEMER